MMIDKKMELSQGDWIVHSRYGLGQVVCLEEKALSGPAETFFNVKTEAFSYWISVSNLDTGRVRPIAGSEEFDQALVLMGQEPSLLDENFHNRLQGINNMLNENTIFSKAELIRDINGRNMRKDIHANEKGILENLKIQFINEFAVSCQLTEQAARTRVQDALKKSSLNIKPKKPAF